jgi:hypothetical protein
MFVNFKKASLDQFMSIIWIIKSMLLKASKFNKGNAALIGNLNNYLSLN